MFSQVKWGPLALALFLAVAMVAQADAAKGSGKGGKGGKSKGAKVEGVLTSVFSNSVTIRRQDGSSITLTVTSATKVELNDRRAAITSLPVGAFTQALYDPATLIATKVESRT